VTQQVALVYRAWEVAHGRLGAYAAILAAPQRASADLAKLKHNDVLLIFVESFGTVVLDDPRYRAQIAPALARFEATMERAGIGIVSNRVLSPSFGGGSWISHGTLLGGIKLDQFLSRLVLESQRKTLPRYMADAGYRTRTPRLTGHSGASTRIISRPIWIIAARNSVGSASPISSR
jgi:hypothetical protein